MTLAAGTRLGPYEVECILGIGGMGEVYRARDSRLKRQVALKVLPLRFSSDPDRLHRFQREAQAASALNHPNVLSVFDVGTDGTTPYVVSELLEGQSLRERLIAGPVPMNHAIGYAIQVAEGLAAVHEKGIIHRDLKPENVFITSDERVKILDFGIAKLLQPVFPERDTTEAAVAEDATEPGRLLGSASYMSPEQVRGESVDRRSDIFSFGAMLFEMLTGRQAFRRQSLVETMSAILRDDPFDAAAWDRLPIPLDHLVRRCLEKRREERFQSVRDIGFALEELLNAGHSRPSPSKTAAVSPALGITSISLVAMLLIMGALAALVAWRAGGFRFGAASTPGQIRSVAVLPFDNLSGDPQQEYFADGITDALITDLAQIGALRVISRTSAMVYKGARTPLRTIAGELQVDAVVEGSVVRAGNRVRVTAQLIDGSTDQHLWADSYERELRDVLELQSEVARAVAAAIKVAITPEENIRLARRRRVEPEAFDEYVKGLYYWNQRSESAVRAAIRHFDQALEKDPTYAAAYAGLADAYSVLASFGFAPPKEVMPKAKAAAERALALDDSLSDAHNSFAFALHRYDRQFGRAEQEFRRAIDLNPGYATAHHWFGLFLASSGRSPEAIAELERARELDPLSSIINTNLGWVLYFARQYDRAIEQYRQVLAVHPDFGTAQWKLSKAYEKTDRYADAFAMILANLKVRRLPELAVAMDAIYRRSGYRAALQRWCDEYEKRSSELALPSTEVAMLYAALGNRDKAFAWLERACEERSTEIVLAPVEPVFDNLRSDPRFAQLLRCAAPSAPGRLSSWLPGRGVEQLYSAKNYAATGSSRHS